MTEKARATVFGAADVVAGDDVARAGRRATDGVARSAIAVRWAASLP